MLKKIKKLFCRHKWLVPNDSNKFRQTQHAVCVKCKKAIKL